MQRCAARPRPAAARAPARPARRAPRPAAAAPRRADQLPPAEWATQPLLASERGGRPERAPPPAWSTFQAAAGGAWRGSLMAASPFTGELEAVRLDAAGKATVLGAVTARAASRAAGSLAERTWWRGEGGAGDAGEEAWEALAQRSLSESDPGLVWFEDGAFSAGPLRLAHALGPAPAAGAEEGSLPACVEMEACLPLPGGRRRLRLRTSLGLRRFYDLALQRYGAEAAASLSVAEREDLLLQQLRCVAEVEDWAGPAPDQAAPPATAAATQPPPPPRLADAARVIPARLLGGGWAAFVRTAQPVPAAAAEPGFAHEAFSATCTFSLLGPGRPYPPEGWEAEEEEEDEEEEEEAGGGFAQNGSAAVRSVLAAFDELDAPSSAREIFSAENEEEYSEGEYSEGEDGEAETGSTLWLPGGVTATVQLGTGPGGDGVTVGAGWLLPAAGGGGGGGGGGGRDTYVAMERQYGGDGALIAVRYSSSSRPPPRV